MAAVPVGALLLIINTLYQMFGVALGVEEESEAEAIVAETEADIDPQRTRLGEVEDVARSEASPSSNANRARKGGDR